MFGRKKKDLSRAKITKPERIKIKPMERINIGNKKPVRTGIL